PWRANALQSLNHCFVLGHFTAMVWKSSTKFGVGKAVASDGSTFVVARYFPAGNITNQGHFQANVLSPKS
uniref:SCP domain-containing protein n=1 Tax=Sinocyclocheilus grahami TaxID=75366 RepID=A0A672R6N4_SINGR